MSSSNSSGKKKSEAIYSPREIGNQMGLWVYGNNWLDVLFEELENMQNYSVNADESMLRGLAFLLCGEGSVALDLFSSVKAVFPLESSLGMAAAFVSLGREKEAEEILEKALKNFPDNRMLKENLKWLKNDK